MSRFLIFTDLHSEIIDNPQERLEALLGAVTLYQPEFIVNLGDFGYFGNTAESFCPTDKQPVNYRYFNEQKTDNHFNRCVDLLSKLSKSDVPVYHTIGNHDVDFATKDEVIHNYKMPNNYYHVDQGELRLVFLDTNYYREDGEEISYLKGNNFAHGNSAILPQEQLKWLADIINTDKQVILLSHHPLNPDARGIQNSDELQSVLNRYPEKKFISFYGHKHVDTTIQIQNCTYININSMSYFWQGEGMLADPIDWSDSSIEKSPMLPYIIRYPEPLFAVVEISGGQLSMIGKSSLTTRSMEELGEKGISFGITDYEMSL